MVRDLKMSVSDRVSDSVSDSVSAAMIKLSGFVVLCGKPGITSEEGLRKQDHSKRSKAQSVTSMDN
jgi:hypothetical protein